METKESTLSVILNRPRFKIYTRATPEEVENALKQSLKSHPDIRGSLSREHGDFTVVTGEEPLWKPHLSTRPEKEEEGGWVIRGTFGPASTVWTFFMFLTFVFGISWMVLFTLWYVGNSIGETAYTWALPASIVFIALLALTYLAGVYGRRKSKPEMEKLRQFAISSLLKLEQQPS